MSDVGGPAVESLPHVPLPMAQAFGTGPKLFTPQQIAVATFLGTAFAGGILLALSHRRAKTGRGYQAILIGTALTTATVLLAVALGERGGMIFPFASVFGMRAIARAQQPALEAATGSAWQFASWGSAIGIGLGSLVGAVVIAMGVGIGWVMLGQPPEVDFGHDQTVQYDHGATEVDARAVGEFLQSAQFFTEHGRGKTVRVERADGKLVVSFVVEDGAWNRPATLEAFEAIRTVLEEKFLGEHVVIHMCDDMMDNQHVVE